MHKTSILVFTQAAGLVQVVPNENVVKNYACMTEKEITDVYPGRSSYITIINFGKVNVHLPENLRVVEVADAPVKVVHIKNERFWYSAGTHANSSGSLVSAV